MFMGKHRIFIAADIPEKTKDVLEMSIKPFYGQSFVKIPKKKDWHITFVFCGYLARDEVLALEKIVGLVFSKFSPILFAPLRVIFAPQFKPRMVWLKLLVLGDRDGFRELKDKIEQEMLKERKKGFFKNFKREKRTPRPHLTLARFRPEDFPRLRQLLPSAGLDVSHKAAPFLVKSLKVMESHLKRGGAEYNEIFEAYARTS
jgi:2'-5' RNA ligase